MYFTLHYITYLEISVGIVKIELGVQQRAVIRRFQEGRTGGVGKLNPQPSSIRSLLEMSHWIP